MLSLLMLAADFCTIGRHVLAWVSSGTRTTPIASSVTHIVNLALKLISVTRCTRQGIIRRVRRLRDTLIEEVGRHAANDLAAAERRNPSRRRTPRS